MTNHFISLNFLFARLASQCDKNAVIFPVRFQINLFQAFNKTPVNRTFEVNLRALSVMGNALAKHEFFLAADAVELKFLQFFHNASIWFFRWIEMSWASRAHLVVFFRLSQPFLYACVAVDLTAFRTFNKMRSNYIKTE